MVVFLMSVTSAISSLFPDRNSERPGLEQKVEMQTMLEGQRIRIGSILEYETGRIFP